jgi:hypothetical protein
MAWRLLICDLHSVFFEADEKRPAADTLCLRVRKYFPSHTFVAILPNHMNATDDADGFLR